MLLLVAIAHAVIIIRMLIDAHVHVYTHVPPLPHPFCDATAYYADTTIMLDAIFMYTQAPAPRRAL